MEFVHDYSFTFVPRFVVRRKGRGHELRTSFFINSLLEALYWMVWQDVYLKNRFDFCIECGKLIWSDSRRERKFCPLPAKCARRHTDRKWKQNMRATTRRSQSKAAKS